VKLTTHLQLVPGSRIMDLVFIAKKMAMFCHQNEEQNYNIETSSKCFEIVVGFKCLETTEK
jgi:hypothetical protein